MAIEVNYVDEKGFEIEKAYLKLETISGTKNGMGLFFNVYKDRAHSKNPNNCITQKAVHNFIPDVEENNNNIFKQAYEYVKDLNEFPDSVAITVEQDINYDVAVISEKIVALETELNSSLESELKGEEAAASLSDDLSLQLGQLQDEKEKLESKKNKLQSKLNAIK